MLPRVTELDRAALLEELVAFLAMSQENTPEPESAGIVMRVGEVPAKLRDSARDGAGTGSVRLSGEEATAYNQLREHLVQLHETEWLPTAELDERLWTLACDLALNPSDYASDAQRRAHAEQFLGDVLRPLRPYEVIFTLEHMAPPEAPIQVWDAHIAVGTAKILAPFVHEVDGELQAGFQEPFLGKAFIAVEVEGTVAGPVIDRARGLAQHRLHVLRTGLADQWQTHPDQLRFALGEYALARARAGEPDGLSSRARLPATPIPVGFHAGHTPRLTELQAVFDHLRQAHPSVREPVERACEWIGRGLCRLWPGDALRDHTTAFEVLLLAPHERFKSLLVPYRMLALADLHGESMIHPGAIRLAYERRGLVVHEGEAEAGDEDSIRRMLSAARDCLRWLVRFAADHPDEEHAKLLTSLDTPSLRQKAMEWLVQFPDQWSRRLWDGVRSLPTRDSDTFEHHDNLLVAAWRQQRAEMLALGQKLPTTYVDFAAHKLSVATTKDVRTFGFQHLLPDLVRGLINGLNRWNYSIRGLEAWARILQGRSDDERLALVMEFVGPLAESTLGTSYRLKQQLIYAAYRALDLVSPARQQVKEGAINFLALERLAGTRPSALALLTALGTLDCDAYQDATGDFRRRLEHRFTPGVEIGLRATLTHEAAEDGESLGFGILSPVSLTEVLPELQAEQGRAVAAFESLWTLVQEVESELRERAELR